MAQNIGNTPYSRYGLGEQNLNLGSIRAAGMAGIGVSAANGLLANTTNPALLAYNGSTVFDFGIAGEYKTLSNSSRSQRDGNANLYTLALSVPVTKRWSSAVNLRPFTSVSYQINEIGTLESNPEALVARRYTGEGGLSEVFWGHGVRITKGLTVGVSASYLFGTNINTSSAQVEDTSLVGFNNERVVFNESTMYRGFLFRAGASYRQKLKDNLFLNLGAVYSHDANINARRDTSYSRITNTDAIVDDNILPGRMEGKVTVPGSLQAGISIDNGSNLTLATELYMQQWSEFQNLEGERELANSYRASIGGEYTPDVNAINSYLKRITYRGGVYYGKTPYALNNEHLTDKGVTVGFTMPIGLASVYEMFQLNGAFGYGKRGTTDNGLIAENYFRFSMGVTINSRWFIKRRLE
ncbi:hypothetical protein [Pontibacter sp. SGAir0037]|uniref:OmpP1/FadL family transporter n=1 Tax=Pontibacter sp. SGAir0037 TaxID=2571030 RepID=UPI001F0DA33C|nr:hypothetical protein [Pontibacter sp. SGAir0037]